MHICLFRRPDVTVNGKDVTIVSDGLLVNFCLYLHFIMYFLFVLNLVVS